MKQTKAKIKEEFFNHRTSWKWFERHIKRFYLDSGPPMTKEEINFWLQLQILKELQFMNDTSPITGRKG